MRLVRQTITLFIESFGIWNAINAGRLASSIAFFGLLSFAPTLVLIAAITSWVLSVQQQQVLVNILGGLLGDQARTVAEMILQSVQPTQGGWLVSLISLGTFFWSATTLFSLLKLALDEIWAVPSDRSSLFRMVRRKLVALIGVLLLALLLALILGISTALNRVAVTDRDSGLQVASTLVDLAGSFVTITLITAAMFKYIPDFRLAWRDVLGGAAVTALLWIVGKAPLQYYLNQMISSSLYSNASTVVFLLFYIYVMTLIFFYGAAVVRVYAQRYGSLKGTPFRAPDQP